MMDPEYRRLVVREEKIGQVLLLPPATFGPLIYNELEYISLAPVAPLPLPRFPVTYRDLSFDISALSPVRILHR